LVQITSDIELSGAGCTTAITPNQLVQSSSENDKTPVGVKVSGADLQQIEAITTQIENAVRHVPGVTSALAERVSGGRYIDIAIDRARAARYGMSVADLQSVVASAIGGENVGEVIEGRQRFPINLRYPRDYRDSVQALRELPVVTARGAQMRLQDVAEVSVTAGPPMIRSENARLAGWVYIDVRGTDLRTAVLAMQKAVASSVKLPAGYAVSWSGQFEYLERATARLQLVVPLTLLVIFGLLYLAFRSTTDALLLMATVPFALVGGLWFIWLLGHAVSVATAVGFIALAGLAAEFGVVMLVYLRNAWQRHLDAGEAPTEAALLAAIHEGAVARVRPKAMTVATILAGLLPIMWGGGAGSEVMQRIAAPMVGGMVTAPLLSLFVIPAAWRLLQQRALKRSVIAVSSTTQRKVA
jgi:Cu(I)/Ag(I) efflux system membrane protein CusA/SilA